MLTMCSLLSVLALAQSSQSARTPVLPEAKSEVKSPGLDQALAKIAKEEYEFNANQGELSAPNRAQDLRVSVSPLGVTVEPLREGSWKLVLRTKSIGREGSRETVADAGPGVLTNSGARAQISHGGWTEWFENRHEGIEQGWTIGAKPAGEGALYVKLGVEGDLSLRIADETGGSFHRANGDLVLRYVGLKAIDSSGRSVRAQLVSHDGVVAIEVDDVGATYPISIDPVISGPAWTYEPDAANARIGQQVCYAGDVNGDGYGDVLVCAPNWLGPRTPPFDPLWSGRVLLFLGSSAGLSSTPSWTFDSPYSPYGDWSLSGVSGLGDFSGDGLADFSLQFSDYKQYSFLFLGSTSGVPVPIQLITFAYNSWPPPSVDSAGDVDGDGFGDIVRAGAVAWGRGAVQVYFGRTGGVSRSWWWNDFQDGSSGELKGAGAGDLNGDGYADLIISAPNGDGGVLSGEGILRIFYGASSGLGTSPSLEFYGGQSGLHLGSTVARGGDVNGDGYADVVVGSAADVRVYLGSSAGMSTTPAWSVAIVGSAVSAGDVNGDGYADVLISTPGSESVSVYLGSSTGVAHTPAWTETSGTSGTGFGTSISGAGDVNGDGFGDLIVSAPSYSNGETLEGRAYVFEGSAAGMSSFATWSNLGSQAGGEYGVSVSLVGDLNADGFSDYVVGASHEDSVNGLGSGRAHVYLGDSLFTLPTSAGSLNGPSANAGFGNWITGAGDTNGDGYDDFLVGSRDASNGESGEGMVFAYYGTATGFDSTPASTFESNQVDAGMGQSVANAGDINGDGYSDVLIGTFKWDDAEGLDQGRAELYLGSATGLGSTAAWSALGQTADDELGRNVSGAGDVNGDGYSDFLVSGYSGGGSGAGYVRCYLGSAAGPVGPVWSYDASQAGAHVGSISSCGDVNGDGYSDIVVGVPQWDGTLDDQGEALVFYGGGSGPSATPSWSVLGPQAGGHFGSVVSSAGDVNDDGYSDVLVTAIKYTNGQADEGAAFIYLGSATGLAATPVWTAEGNQDGAWLGASASGPGDVNGDGFSDILLGAPGFGLLQQHQGSVSLYLGNGAVRGGSPVGARPVTLSGSPLGLLGAVSDVSFKIRARGHGALATASTPGGRGRARLECQVNKPGKPLSDAVIQAGSWSPTGPVGSSLTLEAQVQGTVRGLDIWRVRTGFGDPLFPHGPWLSMPGNARTELDLRSPPDCNGNGVLDATEADCDANGAPDSCDLATGLAPDCNANGVPDTCDITSGFSNDCNGNGIPDICDLTSATSPDCNINGVPDSCDIANGSSSDCNGNGVPDSCDLSGGIAQDCNANGNPDSCDISSGISVDCDANGVPDTCDLANGGPDCNANGILDSCDIASGFSQDINLDGIPDSCQEEFASMCFGDGSGTPCPCNNVSASGHGCPNSTEAQGALLQVAGFPSRQYDTLVLSGTGMKDPSTVLYLQGTGLNNGGFGLQYGDGLACVGGSVVRLGWRTNEAGASTIGPGIATIGHIPVGGGVTRYYSAWYRDASPSYCTANRFNFTNAVSVVWVP